MKISVHRWPAHADCAESQGPAEQPATRGGC